ncbi:hypothetical protein PENSPDRAFT_114868 [Peniophora sp. CONT]|nr:hypothetical protein PENSPDRAFT_114868 [Peniophora sp. CONT]
MNLRKRPAERQEDLNAASIGLSVPNANSHTLRHAYELNIPERVLRVWDVVCFSMAQIVPLSPFEALMVPSTSLGTIRIPKRCQRQRVFVVWSRVRPPISLDDLLVGRLSGRTWLIG